MQGTISSTVNFFKYNGYDGDTEKAFLDMTDGFEDHFAILL